MEIWDAYLEDGSLAGRDLLREEPVPDGLFHLVCEVVVRHSDGDFLLVQRDFRKKIFPGLYEASAGGSVLKGETAEAGARRELWEETGIIAKELAPLYRTACPTTHGIYQGFLCITDCPKDSVVLQEGETISYQWMPLYEFREFVTTKAYVPNCAQRIKPYLDTIQ